MDQSSRTDADVVIAGGGPGGATTAFFLAKMGWRVTLLEKEKFPRFQVGESLLPYNNDLFDQLGITEQLDRHGFVDKRGAEFVTGDGSRRQKFFFRDNLPGAYSRSYQVRRSEFDQILLDAARSAGAEIIEEARIVDADLADGDSCTVTWADREGNRSRVHGRFLVDASGAQGRVTSAAVSRVDNARLKKISFFAHYDGVKLATDGSKDITIVVLRDGWAWLIPIDETTTSFGIVVDHERWAAGDRDRETFVDTTIRGSSYLSQRLGEARRVSEIRARKDFSYTVDRMVGPNFVLVGDTAGFIDPIFSTGVFLAMKSAEEASAAIDRRLRVGSTAGLRRYERKMRRVLDRYLRIIEYFYRREFVEVFLHPQARLGLVSVVVGLLAGNGFAPVGNLSGGLRALGLA